MNKFLSIPAFFTILLIISFNGYSQVDSKATSETKNLYCYLQANDRNQIIFGQQHFTAFGAAWKDARAEFNRSDCQSSVGSHPAILGVNYGRNPLFTRTHIQKVYDMGGIITMHWTFRNPINGKHHTNKEGNVVQEILPGGSYHDHYKFILDSLARFANTLFDDEGKLIPVLFRPFHENNGELFWWSADACSPEEFIQLYRFTVNYLMNEGRVHNFLYVYSPGGISENNAYTKRYPGDDVVDIIGFERKDNGNSDFVDNLLEDARLAVRLADEKGKLAALTEVGYKKDLKSNYDRNWYNHHILRTLKNDELASGVAYMVVWNNLDIAHRVPIEGDKHYKGFVKFYEDAYTTFLNDLPLNLYENCNNNETNYVTSIAEEQQKAISIYPNPAIEGINIKLDLPEDDVILVKIVDSRGKLVYINTFEIKDKQHAVYIRLHDFPAGNYMCSIKGKNNNIELFEKLILVK